LDIETIRRLVREGNYYFYAHALTEAKKDGVTPEDAVHVILIGRIIEEYAERNAVAGFPLNGARPKVKNEKTIQMPRMWRNGTRRANRNDVRIKRDARHHSKRASARLQEWA